MRCRIDSYVERLRQLWLEKGPYTISIVGMVFKGSNIGEIAKYFTELRVRLNGTYEGMGSSDGQLVLCKLLEDL